MLIQNLVLLLFNLKQETFQMPPRAEEIIRAFHRDYEGLSVKRFVHLFYLFSFKEHINFTCLFLWETCGIYLGTMGRGNSVCVSSNICYALHIWYLVRNIMSLSECPWNYLWYHGVVIPKSLSSHYTSLKIDYVDNVWSGQWQEEACLHNFCVFLEECHDSVGNKVTRNLHSPRHIHYLLFQFRRLLFQLNKKQLEIKGTIY